MAEKLTLVQLKRRFSNRSQHRVDHGKIPIRYLGKSIPNTIEETILREVYKLDNENSSVKD